MRNTATNTKPRRWVKHYIIEQTAKTLTQDGYPEEQARQAAQGIWTDTGERDFADALTDYIDYLLIEDDYPDGRIKENLGYVLARLPRKVFDRLQQLKIIYLVVNEAGGRVTNHIWPQTLQQGEEAWIVTLSQEMANLPPDAIRGTIAHELAHVYLRHGYIPPIDNAKSLEERIKIAKTRIKRRLEEAPKWEQEADRIAISWGFRNEVEASTRHYGRKLP